MSDGISISINDKAYGYAGDGLWFSPEGSWLESDSIIQVGAQLTLGDATISISKGTTQTQLNAIGKVLEGLTLSEATTGPSQQQKIDEALGKIHTIIGGHPHLGNEFSEEIYEALHPTPIKPAATQQIGEPEEALDELKSTGLVRKDGTIDFSKLSKTIKEYNKEHSGNKIEIPTALDLKKANLSVNIKVENDVFEMTFNGNCGEATQKVLDVLKTVVNKKFEDKGLKGPITLDTKNVLLGDDAAVLERGGIIQIKTFPNGKMLKLTLDPGQNGQDDGLTIETKEKESVKIPLSAVFGGEPYQGVQVKKDGHPILEDYKKRELFLKARPRTEEERILPFTSRFANIKDNKQEAEAASNELWGAVRTYLEATLPSESNSDAGKLHTEAGPQASTGRTEELSSTMRWELEPPETQPKVPAHLNSIPTLKDISKQASRTLYPMPLVEISATSTQGIGAGVLNLAANEDNLLAAAHSVIDAVIQLLNAKEAANVTPEVWGKLSVLIENLITTAQTFSTDPTRKQRLIDSTKTVVTALKDRTPENVNLDILLELAKIVNATVSQLLGDENIKNFSDLFANSNELNILTLATCTPKDPKDYIPFLESIIQGLGFKKEELTDEFVPEKMFLTSKPYVTSMLRNNTSLAQRQLAAYLNQKINVINDPQTKPEDLSSVGTDLKELATFLNDQIKARVKIFPEPESSPGNATP